MQFYKQSCRCALLIGIFTLTALLPASAAQYVSPDEAVQMARQMFLDGVRTPAKLQRLHDLQQRGDDHVLLPYIEYWWLSARVSAEENAVGADLKRDIESYLERQRGMLTADLLRRDWLLKLGDAGEWETFDAQFAQWNLNDDREVTCYALLSRYQRGRRGGSEGKEHLQDTIAAARQQFLATRALGPGCTALANVLVSDGVLKRADIWQRIRNLFELNYLTAARKTADYLPESLGSALTQISARAALWLGHQGDTLHSATQHELVVLALSTMAAPNPAQAAAAADRPLARQLHAAERAYVWGQIAVAAARKLMPEAQGWYARAHQFAAEAAAAGTPVAFDADVLEWQVRSALFVQDWGAVRRAIEPMPRSLQQDPAWIYWLGRAHQAEGEIEKARQQFLQLALQYSFYGKLAQEALGGKVAVPARAQPLSADELRGASRNPHFARALAFYQMGLRAEGHREWSWGLRGMTDRQLLAAAEYARRNEMLDRAIHAAERTRIEHDFSLRFPSPHRELMQAQTAKLDLDPALIYGLIRQESRFVQQARSSVGANGLMQLMPRTAHWVAKKIGLKSYRHRDIGEIETNILLGTNYFRMVLDDLDGSAILASAAYNAGPSRARAWRASLSQPVEGAIFAENIPFSETRDYVKKVLSNAVDYSALWEGKPQSLRARLGTIAPKEAGQTELP